MRLKYNKDGSIGHVGFEGSSCAPMGTHYDVRLDALKLPQNLHNKKVMMEQHLKNLAFQKEQQIKREIHAAQVRAKHKFLADTKKRQEAYANAQKKFQAEVMKKAISDNAKIISNAIIPLDTKQSLTKNSLKGFGSGEGEVYYQGPSHKIKADFNMMSIERVEDSHNTDLTKYFKSENQKLNQYYVDQAIGRKKIPGQGAFPDKGKVKKKS